MAGAGVGAGVGAGAPRSPLSLLHEVLCHFPLQHAEEHAIPEFATTWTAVVDVLRQHKQGIRATTLADVLINIARQERFADERVEAIADTLRIKCVALNQGREWYMLQLLEQTAADDEPATNAVSLMTHRIGRALRDAYRFSGLTPEVHCVKMSHWCYVSVQLVSVTGRSKTPLYLAVPYGYSVVLISRRANKKLLTTIAAGLGYASIVDARLSGQHLDSLLRIHEQEQNTNIHNLAEQPVYDHQPAVHPHGIDYINEAYNDAYVDKLLGPDPPILNKLEMTTEQPFFDETFGDTMKIRVTMSSDNIAGTLKDMVKMKVIPANSVWFNIFNTMNSNQLSGVAFDVDEND